MGGDTAFIGKVGDDQFGNSTIDMLRGEGIDVSALKVTAEAPSGVAIITTIDSGENNIVLDSGANACLTAADVREAEALFADASIVLMQLETPGCGYSLVGTFTAMIGHKSMAKHSLAR